MASFFMAERNQAGWRFGLLWIVLTLVGFILGLLIEWLIFGVPNLYFAVPLAAIGQGWVLNRHIAIYIPWAGGTTISWLLAALLTRAIVGALVPQPNLLLDLATVSVVAGILSALVQWLFMRVWLPSIGIWWIIIGAISWQLPGIISGLVLTPFVSHDKVSIEGKVFVLSDEGSISS